MSASWSGSMRGPRMKTPLLLLLLLLLSALTQTVLCQDEDVSPVPEVGEEEVQEDRAVPEEGAENTDPEPDPDPEPEPDPDPEPEPEPDPEVEVDPKITTDEDVTVEEPTVEDNGSGENQDTGETENDPNMTNTQEDEGLSLIIILIPVVLVVLIIGMIVCGIFINRRWNKKGRNQELRQEDPYLDGSSTEKVPMPMFEEDVPSVLELEMEELDQWMKKDGETTEDTKHE